MLKGVPDTWSSAEILGVRPAVDGGRWPIKRITGQAITVTADIVTDGHDVIGAAIQFGPKGGPLRVTRMDFVGNDTYSGTFSVGDPGLYTYQVRAWVDQFSTWRELFRRRVEGGCPAEELVSELSEGVVLLNNAAAVSGMPEAEQLARFANAFLSGDVSAALDPEVALLAARCDPREGAAAGRVFEVLVERERAQFSACVLPHQ